MTTWNQLTSLLHIYPWPTANIKAAEQGYKNYFPDRDYAYKKRKLIIFTFNMLISGLPSTCTRSQVTFVNSIKATIIL